MSNFDPQQLGRLLEVSGRHATVMRELSLHIPLLAHPASTIHVQRLQVLEFENSRLVHEVRFFITHRYTHDIPFVLEPSSHTVPLPTP